MDHHSKLVALVLALGCGSASAFYATPAVPSGFSGTSAAWFYSRAATDSIQNSVIRTSALLNTGGVSTKIPVAIRIGAGASRVAAAAAFGWPGLFLAAGVAAYSYFQAEGYQAQSDGWYKARTLPGTQTYQTSNYCIKSTLAAAISCAWPGRETRNITGSTYEELHPTLFYWSQHPYTVIPGTPPETVYDKLSRQQFEDGFAAVPLPQTLPDVWPATVPIKWPVEAPILNPDPALVPKPMLVPVGDPVPVPLPDPNTANEPQTYTQPVVKVSPSPTVSDPWRVDVTPKDITSTNPVPVPDPATDPSPAPDPSATSADTPPGLCDQYPDILACAKPRLGDLEPMELANESRALAIAKDDGWGPSNGSCPAARTAVVMGQSISMPMTGICDFASAIRPIMIGLAWFSAALVFFGLGRKE